MTTPLDRPLRTRARLLGVVLAGLVATGGALGATAARGDPGRRPTSTRTAAIIVRAMAYDRTLVTRAGSRADLLLLTTAARLETERATFAPLESVGVQGLPLLVTAGAPQTVDELRALIVAHHAEAVYVDELPPAVAAGLRVLARELGCVVFARDRAALDFGAHVVVAEQAGATRLIVSLPELRAARIELASDLLKLAEVIR